MKFASKEEMLAYEVAREKYYMRFLGVGAFELYVMLLKEVFIPKYRKLKKEYNGYFGGWYVDEKGFIHSKHISCVDLDKIVDGDVCITDNKEYYVFKDDVWHRLKDDE